MSKEYNNGTNAKYFGVFCSINLVFRSIKVYFGSDFRVTPQQISKHGNVPFGLEIVRAASSHGDRLT